MLEHTLTEQELDHRFSFLAKRATIACNHLEYYEETIENNNNQKQALNKVKDFLADNNILH